MKKRTKITICGQGKYFRLDTDRTTYLMGVADGLFLGHFYYGGKLFDEDPFQNPVLTPPSSENAKERCIFMDSFPFEYPGWGAGDSREGALKVKDETGATRTQLLYQGYEVLSEKPKIPGLPSTFANEGEEVPSLRIDLSDPDTGVEVSLYYSVFAECDAIARSVVVRNGGKSAVQLERVLSSCLDMTGRDTLGRDFELLTFQGIWAREFTRDLRPIGFGRTSVSSICGKTGNKNQSFLGLVSPGITQNSGEVYGFQFLYSGNFCSSVEKCPNGDLRVSLGIHPEEFSWSLQPGESFYSPEVVMTYSDEGLGTMSRNFHHLFHEHLIRGKYTHSKRPILINNWEATYFDFNTEKLLDIARTAKDCGIEMLVMDDGWFGKRNDDSSSLGDWVVNEEKLPGGLSYLGGELEKMGMKFGIWVEPEMVSPDSDLYRAHPDWAIAVPGREPARSRNQLVLDISRKDVRDAVFSMLEKVLLSTKISYVKWDMNRHLSDLYSAELPAGRQGEFLHRYVLGVYDLQERLLNTFPDLLLENCSSGGARFDPGMLYYSPQIWTSDDTDAFERIKIQEGAATLYPLSCLGAHVSICPNHVTGRTVPFETRGNVALMGTFGYELDITTLSDEEKAQIRVQTSRYHRYNDLVREGEYYRMASFRENGFYDCYGVVSQDRSEMLLTMIHVRNQPCYPNRTVPVFGLLPEGMYRVTEIEKEEKGEEAMICVASGAALAKAGLRLSCRYGDYQSVLLYVKQIDPEK